MSEPSKDKLSLKYEEELAPFRETIEAVYIKTSSSDVVFRNILTLPPTILDSTPQSKRRSEDSPIEETIILSSEEVEEMKESEKKEYIGKLAISVFTSYQKCYDNAQNIVNRIAKKYSYEEAETFLYERLGCHIVKLQFDESVGLIQKEPNKKGHKNVLLNEEVEISSFIKETYEPLNIDDLLISEDNTISDKDIQNDE